MRIDLTPLFQLLAPSDATVSGRYPGGANAGGGGFSPVPPSFSSTVPMFPPGVSLGASNIVPVSGRSSAPPGPPPPAVPVAPPIFNDPNIGGDTAGTGTTSPGDTSLAGRQSLQAALNTPSMFSLGPFSIPGLPSTINQGVIAGSKLAMSAIPVPFVGPIYSALLGLAGRQNAAQIAAQQAQQAKVGSIFSGGTGDDGGIGINPPGLPSDPTGELSEGAIGIGNVAVTGTPATAPTAAQIAAAQAAAAAPAAPAVNPNEGITAAGGLSGHGPVNAPTTPSVAVDPTMNVVEGPPGSSAGGQGPTGPGSGVSAGLSAAGEVGVAGQSGPGDGGGGGAGGGGCFLATFGMEALDARERQRARAFFDDFYRLYMRDNPPGGRQLFRKYQMVARQIIARIREEGQESKEQQYIYDKLIKPTGDFIEKKEIPGAVRNLKTVVTTLARRYGVPIPADTSVPNARGAESQGRPPASPVMSPK